MQKIFLVVLLLITLSACRESNEDAYIRGYEDGITEVCYELERTSDANPEKSYEAGVDQRQAELEGRIANDASARDAAEPVNIATGEDETISSLYKFPQDQTVFGNIDGMFGVGPNLNHFWARTFGQLWPGSVSVESTKKKTLYNTILESFTQAINEDCRLSVDERRIIYNKLPTTGVWESDESAKAALKTWHDTLVRRYKLYKRARYDPESTSKMKETAATNMIAIESLLAQLGDPKLMDKAESEVNETSNGVRWRVIK